MSEQQSQTKYHRFLIQGYIDVEDGTSLLDPAQDEIEWFIDHILLDTKGMPVHSNTLGDYCGLLFITGVDKESSDG